MNAYVIKTKILNHINRMLMTATFFLELMKNFDEDTMEWYVEMDETALDVKRNVLEMNFSQKETSEIIKKQLGDFKENYQDFCAICISQLISVERDTYYDELLQKKRDDELFLDKIVVVHIDLLRTVQDQIN